MVCKGLRVRRPQALIKALSDLKPEHLLVNLRCLETEETFLRYLSGWNNQLLTHICQLLQHRDQCLQQDDPKWRQETCERLDIAFNDDF